MTLLTPPTYSSGTSCRYMKRPRISGPGLYDPTDVMNRAQMNYYTREGFVKLGFYVVSFLVYLYKYVIINFCSVRALSVTDIFYPTQHDGSTRDGSDLISRLIHSHISELTLPSFVATRQC